jgi:hypothetical protein
LATLPSVPEYWRATPDRVQALLAKAGVVHHQHTVAFGFQRAHLLDALPVQRLRVPGHLGQQTLELLLTRARHDRRQCVAVLICRTFALGGIVRA